VNIRGAGELAYLSKPRTRRAWPAVAALWFAPLAFLGLFFFYPLVEIFRLALFPTPDFAWKPFRWEDIYQPLSFTAGQAILSTLLTFLVGLPAAYLFGRFRFPGKRLLRVLTTLPFIMPTVVVAAGFNALLGPRGWVNLALMAVTGGVTPPIQFVNTLGAILLAHVFYNTTIVIRLVGSAWAQLDPRLEQAAQVLGSGRWRSFWEVSLPLLRPALVAAALLVFIFDFTSFGVVLLLGGPHFATLEVEIYIQALQMLNLPLAGLLSLIQLMCTLALTVIYTRISGRQAIPLAPRSMGEGMHPARTLGERIFSVLMVIVLISLLVAPLAALVGRSFTTFDANRGQSGPVIPGMTLAYYQELFINRSQSLFYVPPILAARNSLIYASLTVVLSVTLGFLAAYALRSSLSLNRWLDPLLMLPLGASAVTLGLGFIITFTRPPLDLRSFPFLLPVAHSLVALPFVVRTLQPALSSIPLHLRQSAAVLGASPLRTWFEVDLPIAGRAVLSSAIFAFTISLGEFGATSFLARPDYPTLPVAIYRFISLPGALNYGQALAMSTLLMVVCGLGIFLIERLNLAD
jgi:thiamine transport system permease protein